MNHSQDITSVTNEAKPKHVFIWFGAACVAFMYLMLTAGNPDDLKLIGAMISEQPTYVLMAIGMSPLFASLLPGLHFGVIALSRSKRSLKTFLSILKGWSIAEVIFVTLGTLAGF